MKLCLALSPLHFILNEFLMDRIYFTEINVKNKILLNLMEFWVIKTIMIFIKIKNYFTFLQIMN